MDSDDESVGSAGSLPEVEPYETLGLDRSATADQIKTAYRRAALRCHPDKVPEERKAAAHEEFQAVAFSYAVLSDPVRRARYDATGSTAESVSHGDDDFNWADFYRAAFAEAVSGGAIEKFAATYKASDEERADVLAAYTRHRGNMDGVYESVMLSDPTGDDDARFRGMIDAAIAAGTVKSYTRYTNETDAQRRARVAKARRESGEAEAYARELGVHDKLFGKKKAADDDDDDDEDDDGEDLADKENKKDKNSAQSKGKGKGKAKGKGKGKSKKEDDQAGLAALIQSRQKDRASNFLDNLAAKYGATEKTGGKGGKGGKASKGGNGGKKRRPSNEAEEEEEKDDDMPSEEAFQAAAARLKTGGTSSKAAKKARR